ncbi:MAG TPA: dTDP-4-dehydrorhamnose 3,5-epimerase [Verrucomicrobiae bacterium]|nr:dTDP-4-dehydrorhamnose 3,5-epimerase [Verrucomicrobiae bacterium]
MQFEPCKLAGAFILELTPNEDSRGLFARTFCAREFAEHGLAASFVQSSVSVNRKRGTLRGLHYQLPPACEVKIVRCTAGALHDVIVDLRPDSPTYLQHVVVELTARNRRALYVPEMFAHGFQSLEDDTEVLYMIDEFFAPDKSTGIRYDDPRLGICWPLPVVAMSEKDRKWPLIDA